MGLILDKTIDNERASLQRMLLLKRVAASERKIDSDVLARIALDEINYREEKYATTTNVSTKLDIR